MVRSLNNYDDKYLDGVPLRAAMHKINMGLCFFHAIVQERRKFGPLGWNIRYEFNDSDLETSKKVIENLLRNITDESLIPWDSLEFLTGTINYGGRVTDDQDRRLLMTVMSRFFRKEILLDNPPFAFCESNEYYIPKVENLQAYKDFAQRLPGFDDPVIFGLHQNANMAYQSQETQRLIKTVADINPITSGGEGGSSDESVTKLCDYLLSEENGVPKIITEILPTLTTENEQGIMPSLTVVLFQEIQRFNNLLVIARDSLEKLRKAIDGTIVMSAVLDNVYTSLLNNQVPHLWKLNAYPSLKPLLSWIRDLKARVAFFKIWGSKGNPQEYWLPGFFFPQGFLTGVKQTFARSFKIAIDKLNFEFRVVDLEKTTANEVPEAGGVYISGLFLEGARWDRRRKSIADQEVGMTYDEMPMILFLPVEQKELTLKELSKKTKEVPSYECPLYKTTLRAGTLSTTGQSTNFVLTVKLPSLDAHPDVWALRGAALICQKND